MLKTLKENFMAILLISLVIMMICLFLLTRKFGDDFNNMEIALPCYSNIEQKLKLERNAKISKNMEFQLTEVFKKSDEISIGNYEKIMGITCNQIIYKDDLLKDQYVKIKNDLIKEFKSK